MSYTNKNYLFDQIVTIKINKWIKSMMSNSYVSTKEQFLCKLTKKPKFNNVTGFTSLEEKRWWRRISVSFIWYCKSLINIGSHRILRFTSSDVMVLCYIKINIKVKIKKINKNKKIECVTKGGPCEVYEGGKSMWSFSQQLKICACVGHDQAWRLA